MFLQFIYFCFIISAMLFLTRGIVTKLFHVLFVMTRHHRTSIQILTSLLLIGTIIHELSHLITALALRVPAGNLTIIPKIEPHGEIKAGSVSVGRSDPFRLTIIGLAPIPAGILMLYIVGRYLPITWYGGTGILQQHPVLQTSISIYLLFSISCSMFSSKKDLHALMISGPVIAILIVVAYAIGIQVSLASSTVESLTRLLYQANKTLLYTILIDGVILIGLKIILRIFRRRHTS